MKLNLPNKLSLLRVLLVPVFVIILMLPIKEAWWRILAAAVFAITSITDTLDGMIARKCNLVTDFGKFIDPLADKFMVFAALVAILYKLPADTQVDAVFRGVFLCAALIVIFRELAVTSMRMIVSSNAGIVVAAAWLGKVKTVTQIFCILIVLLEPLIFPSIAETHLISYILLIAMTVMTVWSGINYLKAYWKYLDPNK